MAVFEIIVKKDGEEIKKMTGKSYLAAVRDDNTNVAASLFVRGDKDVIVLLGACVSVGSKTMIKGAELQGKTDTEIQKKYEKMWREILEIAGSEEIEINFSCKEENLDGLQ